MTFKCDDCGKTVEEAYNITQYINSEPIFKTVCRPCLEQRGIPMDDEEE